MRWLSVLLVLLVLSTPSLLAGGYYPRYYPRYYPSYSYYQPYYPVYEEPYVPPPTYVQPVIIEERLAPAFVFQVLTAYNGQTANASMLSNQQAAQYNQQTSQPAQSMQPMQSISAQSPVSSSVSSSAMEQRLARLEILLERKLGTDSTLPMLNDGTGAKTPGAEGGLTQERLQKMVNWLGTTCSSCHQPRKENGFQVKGNVQLFTDKGQFNPSKDGQPLPKGKLYSVLRQDVAGSPSMPPTVPRDPSKRAPADILETIRIFSEQ